MLTERRARLLELLIGEYVRTAAPVGSETIVRNHDLTVSPATIRNEMARLEEDGYITHPHTSAGRVPSDKGYRYYVESLMVEEDLPWELKETIRHQFFQAQREREEWLQLAATILARVVRNAAVVIPPRAAATRLKHLEIVAVHDFLALLVLVLEQAVIREQLLTLPEALAQESLETIAARLNGFYHGMTVDEIAAKPAELSPVEEQVAAAARDMMNALDRGEHDQAYLDGIRYVLGQPEFAHAQQMLDALELLNERSLVRALPFRSIAGQGITVIIGREKPAEIERGAPETLDHFSIILSGYGLPGGNGVVAVLGPTRMQYAHNISTVRYLSQLMGELVTEYYT